MDITITKQKAEFNKSEFGSDKDVVVVTFPNCPFKWIPSYKHLTDIKSALDDIEIESWNKKIDEAKK